MSALDVSIDHIRFIGFTVDGDAPIPSIDHYRGRPFYYHVKGSGGTVKIKLDQKPPSNSDGSAGNVSLVTLIYDDGTNPQQVDFKPSGSPPIYAGLGLRLSLEFQPGKVATLILDGTQPALLGERPLDPDAVVPGESRKLRPKLKAPTGLLIPTLGIVIASGAVTGTGKTVGYFVDIPLSALTGTATTDLPTSANVEWLDDGPGSSSGPMGNVNFP